MKARLTDGFNEYGFAIVRSLFNADTCDGAKYLYKNSQHFRNITVICHQDIGSGEYKYFSVPPPRRIRYFQECVNKILVNATLYLRDKKNTTQMNPFDQNEDEPGFDGNTTVSATLMRLGKGDFKVAQLGHNCGDGRPHFAFVMLSRLNIDFKGGEFLLPRKKIERKQIDNLQKYYLDKGDLLVFPGLPKNRKCALGRCKEWMDIGINKVTFGEIYALKLSFINT